MILEKEEIRDEHIVAQSWSSSDSYKDSNGVIWEGYETVYAHEGVNRIGYMYCQYGNHNNCYLELFGPTKLTYIP